MALACHEVRGPLTAVRLGLELRQLSHTRLRAIELELGRATVALNDLSAVPVHRNAAQLGPVDITELVATSVEAWRAVAAAQAATICLEAAPRPFLVPGDRLRLAQAVGNLLANAIEHGGGAVQVQLRPGAGAVRIEIVDRGPGLPASIDQLVRRPRRRGQSEHGHGLRVASRIAASHGGRLVAAPSEFGARIVLELPGAPGPGRH